jgi:hypothetical protein
MYEHVFKLLAAVPEHAGHAGYWLNKLRQIIAHLDDGTMVSDPLSERIRPQWIELVFKTRSTMKQYDFEERLRSQVLPAVEFALPGGYLPVAVHIMHSIMLT